MSLQPPLFEASHRSPYPGQEAGNPGEDCWRSPHLIYVGDDALGHVVTHKGAPGVPLWATRGRDTKPGLHSPGLPAPAALRPALREDRGGWAPSTAGCV